VLVDVSAIIERQKLTRFLVGLVTISWIITFFDGLDANLISFAAPYFRMEYRLTTVQTGNIFGMHQLGTLIGGFVMAYVGDRIGRRPAVILSTAGFGVLTMLFYYATSYESLFWLRLIDGIPLGGMLPLAWALNIEYAPKKYRATIVTLIMIGYSVGTALGGQIANLLIPEFGWKSLFVFGGGAAIVSSIVLFLMLPESIRFLASKGASPERITAILRRMNPEESIPAKGQFIVGDEPGHSKDFRPALLFQGQLRRITPLLWIAYIASSFAVFFIVNWTPLVFEALQYTRAQAATAATMTSLMGAVGGVLLMRFTDKYGPIAITVMPVITATLLLFAGFVTIGQTAFFVLNALIGLFLIGGHFGMHSISGLFYPTAYRANGAGWATSIAKIGSISGPIVGGWVLSTSLPVRNIFAVLAICPMIFAVCIYAIGRLSESATSLRSDPRPLPQVATSPGTGASRP
jgi:MFS transporter, AAHS family, 4-hydroxybenzoate transporter